MLNNRNNSNQSIKMAIQIDGRTQFNLLNPIGGQRGERHGPPQARPWSVVSLALLLWLTIVTCPTRHVHCTPASSLNTSSSMSQSTDFVSKWTSMMRMRREWLERAILPNYVNLTRDIVANKNVSEQCRKQVSISLDAFNHRQLWAYQMYNAWGRFPPTGSLSGTLTDFGDYDQCLSLSTPTIAPKYCLVDLEVPMPKPMPRFHNYFQKSFDLQAIALKTMSEQELDQLFGQPSVNGTIYGQLANVSSVFYYVYVRVGVCVPRTCQTNDLESVIKRGEYSKTHTFQVFGNSRKG